VLGSEHRERLVGRAVVDCNHLVAQAGCIQHGKQARQQRLYALLLVEHRDDDRQLCARISIRRQGTIQFG